MKINVLGAGPAGLYFAILMKRADPRHQVRVFERNHPDATFGWGVVFSEGSLDELVHADYESFVSITEACANWNPIDVRYRGISTRIRGNVFSGVGRRRL
ncbi:MAG TPA: NAD(P)-binding protein, partial [Candidatus Dormibacteraeota bacterium]|nr:NAD(P)-binding protein [Candidatus Dormibacteraeota bacterium]